MEIILNKLHSPDRRFTFPHEVVEDPSLSVAEKRALLSEWASDASAVEACPTLRLLPGTSFPVTFSAVMDAFDQLDREVAGSSGCADRAMPGVIVADFARRRRNNDVNR